MGILLILSNDFHHLFYTVCNDFSVLYHAPFYLIHAYNYLCAGAALLLLLAHYKKNGRPSRGMVAAALGAVSFVLAADLFEYLVPLSSYDLTPASLAVAQVFFLVGGSRLQEFRSLLSTRINVLDGLNETVILTDRENRVVYYNETDLGRRLRLRADVHMDDVGEWKSPAGEMVLDDSEPRHFLYYVQPIKKEKGDPAGRVYAFREITQHKTLIAQLDQKNKELLRAQQELRRHAELVKQLTEETERNRILRVINQTVGQHIYLIIRHLSATRFAQSPEDAMKERLPEAIRCARMGIDRIRESVSVLAEPESRGGTRHDQGVDR